VGGRKSPFPITLASGLYNSLYYRTSCDVSQKRHLFLFFVIIIIIVVYYELSKRNWTRITQSKISRFQQFLEYGIPRTLATSRLVDYKFAHFTWEMSLQYLVKFSIIIVTSFLQKYKKMFEWRSKDIKQKLLCVCFLYNIFCLCYFYSQSYVLG